MKFETQRLPTEDKPATVGFLVSKFARGVSFNETRHWAGVCISIGVWFYAVRLWLWRKEVE